MRFDGFLRMVWNRLELTYNMYMIRKSHEHGDGLPWMDLFLYMYIHGDAWVISVYNRAIVYEDADSDFYFRFNPIKAKWLEINDLRSKIGKIGGELFFEPMPH